MTLQLFEWLVQGDSSQQEIQRKKRRSDSEGALVLVIPKARNPEDRELGWTVILLCFVLFCFGDSLIVGKVRPGWRAWRELICLTPPLSFSAPARQPETSP